MRQSSVYANWLPMAEVIGLAASIVGLAGAAASVSLTLYEFVGTVRYAKEELNALAIEASDLSTVLDHLSAILNQNTDCIIAKTVETIDTLIKRCERLLEEFGVTIDLVKARATHIQWLLRKRKTQEMKLSLEAFKSTLSLIIQTVILGKTMKGTSDQDHRSKTVRRNINVLSSAVLSNRRLIEKLNAAEETAKRPRPIEADSSVYGEGSAAEEKLAADAFQQELKKATAPRETSIVLSSSKAMDKSAQLLRAYDDMRREPLASTTISSSLPSSVTQTRANTHRPFGLLTDASGSEPRLNERENPTQEIRFLLTEWTSTAQDLLKDYFDDPSNGNTTRPSQKENSSEQHKNNFTNQRSKSRSEPSTYSSNTENSHGGSSQPQFLTYEAWSSPEIGQKPLVDCFSERGGGYIWRHEDQASRWYYIGEKMVLEYRIRHPKNEAQRMRTVVSKQWIPKTVLSSAGYDYTEYGEGSYVIPKMLTIQDVRNLHVLASEETEKRLRRLAQTQPKKIQRQTVKAVSDFYAIEPADLSFKKGDVFEADVDLSLGWWQGYKDGASGRFRANYVEQVITTVSNTIQSPRPRCKIRALSDFHPTRGSELSFLAGDIIEVEEDLYQLRWKGYLNGRQGLVPAHRVLVTSPTGSSSSESQLTGLISEGLRRTAEKVRKTAVGKS